MDFSSVDTLDFNIKEFNFSDQVAKEKFWRIYFSDKRYFYYFFSLSFSFDYRKYAETILVNAALRGDPLAADFVVRDPDYVELAEIEFNDYKSYVYAIIMAQELNHAFYFYDWIDRDIEIPDFMNDFDFKNYFGESFNFQLSKIDRVFQWAYLRDQIDENYQIGNLEFYSNQEELINLLRKFPTKLLSDDQFGAFTNLLFYNIRLGESFLAYELIKEFYKSINLEISDDPASQLFEIYKSNIEFEIDTIRVFFVLLLNIVNVHSEIMNHDPNQFAEKIDNLNEYLEEVIQSRRDYYPDSEAISPIELLDLKEAFSGNLSTQYAENGFCFEAETYLKEAHMFFTEKIGEDYEIQFYDADLIYDAIQVSRCFLQNNNIESAKNNLLFTSEQIKKDLDRNNHRKFFLTTLLELNMLRVESFTTANNDLFESFRKLSDDFFAKSHNINFNISEQDINDLIIDYISLVKYFIDKGFQLDLIEEISKLEEIKSYVGSDARLQNLKISSTKSNIKNLKVSLEENKKALTQIEDSLLKNSSNELFSRLDKLYFERRKIIETTFESSNQISSLMSSNFRQISEIKKDLDSESAIISYTFGRIGGFVSLIKNNSIEIIPLNIGKLEIENKIRSLNNSAKNFKIPFRFDRSLEVYEIIFKPLEPYIKDIKNFYILDSDLKNLHPAILISHIEDSNNSSDYENLLKANWLIKDYSFARIFPISGLKKNISFDEKFLGIGNPVSIEDIKLPLLMDTELEIRNLAISSEGYKEEHILTKAKASKNLFYEAIKKSFERVVFATHALPPRWKGLSNESSLVFSANTSDFLLSASEIIDLNLKTDLVVLSSCNSAGPGSMSLYKSFLVAGSNSVIYSNWDLETISAAQLTNDIFKNILFESSSKHEAIRQASLKLMNDYSNKTFAHPAFWGNLSVAYRSL